MHVQDGLGSAVVDLQGRSDALISFEGTRPMPITSTGDAKRTHRKT